jgi:hypothetical protein
MKDEELHDAKETICEGVLGRGCSSGAEQRAIADDLGIGSSTLVRWLGAAGTG